MNKELDAIKYLINQLVDVRVACQFWIDKDEKTQNHIKELEAKLKTSETENLKKDALIYDYRKNTKDLEEQLGHSYDSGLEAVNPKDIYGEGPYYPDKFTLNNVTYFEDETGCYRIANHTDEGTTLTVSMTHQEYVDVLNQYLKQEDPRDYPEEQSE